MAVLTVCVIFAYTIFLQVYLFKFCQGIFLLLNFNLYSFVADVFVVEEMELFFFCVLYVTLRNMIFGHMLLKF